MKSALASKFMYRYSSTLKNGMVLKIQSSLPPPYGVWPVGKRVICSGILSIWIGTFPIRRGNAPHSSTGECRRKNLQYVLTELTKLVVNKGTYVHLEQCLRQHFQILCSKYITSLVVYLSIFNDAVTFTDYIVPNCLMIMNFQGFE